MMSTEWMPREKWDALVRGEDCPMCGELASGEDVNDYGFTVARLSMSVLRLSVNQNAPGYCVLICKRHVREPYELSAQECGQYFEDMMQVGLALERVYQPIKMNFQILGNALPHLHCHIIPRYYGDAAPGRPIDPLLTKKLLTPEEYTEQIAAIRAALG
jgi:diadenosine tetraphosphate (Ap4A) HIT family hydrolase